MHEGETARPGDESSFKDMLEDIGEPDKSATEHTPKDDKEGRKYGGDLPYGRTLNAEATARKKTRDYKRS